MLLRLDIAYVPDWQADFLWVFVAAFIFTGCECFCMGANNVANAFVPAVASGVIRRRTAYILCAFFDFLGCALLGYQVTNTLQKGIINIDVYDHCDTNATNATGAATTIQPLSPENWIDRTSFNATDFVPHCSAPYTDVGFMIGCLGTIIGATGWLAVANMLKLPVSVTHTVVSATTGFTLAFRGGYGLHWQTLAKIVASWFISPVLAGVAGIILYTIIKHSALTKSNQFIASIKILPVCYFFTVSVVTFLVLITRSKYLYFDQSPPWGDFLASIIIGFVAAMVVRVFLVHRIAAWAQRPDTPRHLEISVTQLDFLQLAPLPTYDEVVAASTNRLNDQFSFAQLNEMHSCTSSYTLRQTTPRRRNFVMEKGLYLLRKLRSPVRESKETGKVFHSLQILSGCCFSFTHGSNVIPTCVTDLVAIWLMWRTGNVKTDTGRNFIPEAINFYGWAFLVIGLCTLGHNIIKTIGQDVTHITPASGFCMQLGAAFAILLASVLGIPISTTHCFVGAVIFVSWYREESAICWPKLRNIIVAWFVTLPVACALGAVNSITILQLAKLSYSAA